MEFRTKVQLPEKALLINHHDSVLVMGSCFAEHIGEWLQADKFAVSVNPYGVLYNPMSILQALEDMSNGRQYQVEDLFEYGGLWHSWMHHSSFSSSSQDEILHHINTINHQMQQNLQHLHLLILTWGTNHAYYLKEPLVSDSEKNDNLQAHLPEFPVGNCHKVPQKYFSERIFSLEEIVDSYSIWLEHHPDICVLFTVSPIRYKKYGFHESNLSKAVLLLAQDELCRRFKNRCFYFPAYEILMDELRDYRFYDTDMVHPADVAVEYVKECFSQCYFSPETQSINQDCESIVKALSHRPLHPETDVYQCFLRKIVLRIQAIKEKYPYLSSKFKNELRLCHTLLKQ